MESISTATFSDHFYSPYVPFSSTEEKWFRKYLTIQSEQLKNLIMKYADEKHNRTVPGKINIYQSLVGTLEKENLVKVNNTSMFTARQYFRNRLDQMTHNELCSFMIREKMYLSSQLPNFLQSTSPLVEKITHDLTWSHPRKRKRKRKRKQKKDKPDNSTIPPTPTLSPKVEELQISDFLLNEKKHKSTTSVDPQYTKPASPNPWKDAWKEVCKELHKHQYQLKHQNNSHIKTPQNRNRWRETWKNVCNELHEYHNHYHTPTPSTPQTLEDDHVIVSLTTDQPTDQTTDQHTDQTTDQPTDQNFPQNCSVM